MSTRGSRTAPLHTETDTVDAVPVRLYLFGPFRVVVAERPVEAGAWGLAKAASLVKLLALAPHYRLHREQLLDHLWPELPMTDAANNLRVALFHARRALAPARLVRQGDTLALAPDGSVWTDVASFAAAVGEAQRSGDPVDGWAAVDLYGGDLLLDDPYEDWVAARREALRQDYLQLLINLTEWEKRRGEVGAAIAALQRIVIHDSTYEEAYRELMRLYAQTGRRQPALRAYEQLRMGLETDGLTPEPATEALYEAIIAGTVAIVPAVGRSTAAASTPRPRLPLSSTSLVGRSHEIDEVRRVMGLTRVLTLTGAGGVGKTRLAQAVAEAIQSDYPDGAFWVDLASQSDPALVPQTVAGALEAQEPLSPTTISTLIERLGGQRRLVILDNCEHLATACAALVEALLAGCPGLRLLITSRGPLHVRGEMVWRVPSLGLPELGRAATAARVAEAPAGQLLLERVRASRADFVVNDSNAPTLARLCHQLDGLPLALELAAARLSTLALDDLVTRLTTSIQMLTNAGRQASGRHQTMQATVEWSFGLLSGVEQVLLHRLGVFVGGFTLEAAEAVGMGDGIAAESVVDLVCALIDQSLVHVDEQPHGTRYRLLEPIRFFAQQRLAASEEEAAVRERHARHYLALAEQAHVVMRVGEEPRWLARLDDEYGNLRAALNWGSTLGDDLELRLAVALGHYWDIRAYFDEGSRVLKEVLGRAEERPADLLARANNHLGNLARRQGEYGLALGYYEAGLGLAREAGDQHRVAGLLNNLGLVAERQGNLDLAWEQYEESMRLADRLGVRWRAAMLLGNMALLAQGRGRDDEATALAQRSLSLMRGLNTLGSPYIDAILLTNLGMVAALQGRLDDAAELLEESLALRQHMASSHGIAGSLLELGLVAWARGDWVRALELTVDSLFLYQETGNRLGRIEAAEGVAVVLASLDRSEEAVRLLAAAANSRVVLGIPVPPYWQARHELCLTTVRDRVGAEALADLQRAGARLSLDEALRLALAVVLRDRINASQWMATTAARHKE